MQSPVETEIKSVQSTVSGSVAQSCDRLLPFVGPGFDSRSRCCQPRGERL